MNSEKYQSRIITGDFIIYAIPAVPPRQGRLHAIHGNGDISASVHVRYKRYPAAQAGC
ncbi:MAG TPA: hypothetical protein PK906_03315 [Spirochaetota bacterium]|nr:hypothetical protein [Spirochaetota bacterium]